MERSAQKFKATLLGLALFAPSLCVATTFGPVPLAGQVDHAPYVIEGRILSRRVDIERTSGKPHTYWGLAVSKQLKGQAVSGEITLRQPGGEVGDLGYQLAGTAQFGVGEEVLVMARDSNEGPQVKDVVGLSSGKYSVENGGKLMRNGLGSVLNKATGEAMTLKELEAFVERANAGQLSEEDRKIIVSPTPHRHAHTDPGGRDSFQSGAKESAPLSMHGGTHETEPNLATSLQKNPPTPEESPEGHEGKRSWLWLAGIFVILTGLGLLIYRLTRK